DRDLWRFDLTGTADVFAAVTSRPYTVEAWDEMMWLPIDRLLVEGRAINRWRDQLIEGCVANAYEHTLFGHRVWVAAAPYAIGSDVAGILAKRNPTLFGAYYVDDGHGRKWGLRSGADGLD
ncbi:MAG TPA: hypothetical protein PLV68_09935, partial [Ilumatobacteraceae bacterium]|nr:hypothetical protein [Ilumatobacteraceae bacterium]